MRLQPFLLDRWLQDHEVPPVEFNLGGSTGPHWTMRDVLDLEEDSRERLLGGTLLYTPSAGGGDLRDAVGSMLTVDPDHVLVVAGASEALLHIFFVASEPDANIIVPFPGYPPYAAVPEAFGLEVRSYRLRAENSYRVDLDEVEGLADARTKLVLVNSPHNPTGSIVRDDEMQRLHDFTTERGIQLVVDEVFHPIYHGAATASAAGRANATVVGDMSKAFSLSGLRLGWIVEPNADRRTQYLNGRQYFTISNTVAGEFIAEVAVRHRETILGRTNEVAATNLRLLDSMFDEHRGALDWVRPAGGMTCFPTLGSGVDTRSFCEAAVSHGILLVPGDCFGVADRFRLGFGVNSERFPLALERLSSILHAAIRRSRT